jgi:hypothetical protein
MTSSPNLTAVAAVVTVAAITLGLTLRLPSPASAVAPPPDGTYLYNQSGVSGVIWTISALCVQASGTRNQADYSDPVIQAEQCALNVVSTTPSHISRQDKLQNYSGRARLASDLWTFTVDQSDGVLCADGSTAPSTETYAFDDGTLTGTHTSLHGFVCGLPSAMSKAPFTLKLTGPAPSPVERYPLYCNNIAMCY